MGEKVTSYRDLRVFQNAMDSAMEIFEITRHFPREEKYALVDQIRRSSRSVCANLAEAWRKRRYKAAFIAKLSDSESEASETQVWLEFALRCGYLKPETHHHLIKRYEHILSQLVLMINDTPKWLLQ